MSELMENPIKAQNLREEFGVQGGYDVNQAFALYLAKSEKLTEQWIASGVPDNELNSRLNDALRPLGKQIADAIKDRVPEVQGGQISMEMLRDTVAELGQMEFEREISKEDAAEILGIYRDSRRDNAITPENNAKLQDFYKRVGVLPVMAVLGVATNETTEGKTIEVTTLTGYFNENGDLAQTRIGYHSPGKNGQITKDRLDNSAFRSEMNVQDLPMIQKNLEDYKAQQPTDAESSPTISATQKLSMP